MIIDQMLGEFERHCLKRRFICAISISHPNFQAAVSMAKVIVPGKWWTSGDALDNPTIAWEETDDETAVGRLLDEVDRVSVFDRELRVYLGRLL